MNIVKIGNEELNLPDILIGMVSKYSAYSKAAELHSTKLAGHVEIDNPQISMQTLQVLIEYCKLGRIALTSSIDLESLVQTFDYFGITKPASVELKIKKQQAIKQYADHEQRMKKYQLQLFSPIATQVSVLFEKFLDNLNSADFYTAQEITDWTTNLSMTVSPQFNTLKIEISIGSRSTEIDIDNEDSPELFDVIQVQTSRDRCLDDLFIFICVEYLGFGGGIEDIVKGCRRWDASIPP